MDARRRTEGMGLNKCHVVVRVSETPGSRRSRRRMEEILVSVLSQSDPFHDRFGSYTEVSDVDPGPVVLGLHTLPVHVKNGLG